MDTQHSRRRGIRFFEWLRGIGIRRQDGWFGGVCGGLAARWGIDPLIVRGIVVVATLLSLPMLLLYALAWFLLPAEDGAIHAESMLNGELAPSQFGILLLLLVALVPGGRGVGWGLVSAGPWQWGWGAWPWFADGWGAFWTVALVVAGVWLVVVAARSRGDRPADGEDRPGGAAAPGTPAGPTAAASAASGVTAEAADAAAGAGGSDSASGAGAQPVDDAGTRRTDPAAAEGSSTAEWSAWAEQRDQWSAQSHAASAPLSDEEQRRRYLNEQRRHRLETARLRREERRARTRRLPAAVSWLVVGVALLVGVGAWALLAPSLGDDALLPSLGATL
ncbi:PspC domain-containing protein, partial [Mycetocola reblochoni]